MHFLNVHHAFENAARLARALGQPVETDSEIPRAYRSAIAGVRPVPLPDGPFAISFEDGAWGRHLIERNVFEDIFVGIRGSDSGERNHWALQVIDSFSHIRSINGDLARIADLLVTDVVVLNSDRNGGGSASHLPGLVCMSPGEKWSMFDFAESLMHEATHLNLFVGEMVHGLYVPPTPELAEDRYRVLSAVKVGELRPLDKAFHSAVVAVPLMYLQHMRGESALVDQFSVSLLECSEGLMDQLDVFTPYGRLLVEQLHRFATTTDFEYVEKSISSAEYATL